MEGGGVPEFASSVNKRLSISYLSHNGVEQKRDETGKAGATSSPYRKEHVAGVF